MLCTRCKKNPAKASHCDECREYKSLWSAGRRDIRKVMGVCTICGGETDGYFECWECRKRRSVNAVKSYRKRRSGVKGI